MFTVAWTIFFVITLSGCAELVFGVNKRGQEIDATFCVKPVESKDARKGGDCKPPQTKTSEKVIKIEKEEGKGKEVIRITPGDGLSPKVEVNLNVENNSRNENNINVETKAHSEGGGLGSVIRAIFGGIRSLFGGGDGAPPADAGGPLANAGEGVDVDAANAAAEGADGGE